MRRESEYLASLADPSKHFCTVARGMADSESREAHVWLVLRPKGVSSIKVSLKTRDK